MSPRVGVSGASSPVLLPPQNKDAVPPLSSSSQALYSETPGPKLRLENWRGSLGDGPVQRSGAPGLL